MPYKITKHPCHYPGCPNLTNESYCENHSYLNKEKNRYYNRNCRSKEIKAKYNANWNKVRNVYISEHPLCELCLLDKHMVPAVEVHHI